MVTYWQGEKSLSDSSVGGNVLPVRNLIARLGVLAIVGCGWSEEFEIGASNGLTHRYIHQDCEAFRPDIGLVKRLVVKLSWVLDLIRELLYYLMA